MSTREERTVAGKVMVVIGHATTTTVGRTYRVCGGNLSQVECHCVVQPGECGIGQPGAADNRPGERVHCTRALL